MAASTAIANVGKALLGLLDEGRRSRFPDIAVAPLMPLHFENGFATLGKQGIGLLLYRVTVNASRRNLPPRRAGGQVFRPSLPVDLGYLLATWSEDVEQQQQLLGWAMRALEDLSVLPAHLLNHYAADDGAFAADEAVELVCDPLALADWLTLWDKLKPNFAAGVTYTARTVLLDSDVTVHEGVPVALRRLRPGVLSDGA